MALIIKNKVVYGGVGGGDNSVDLTMAEYKALEAAGTVMSDTTYYITDADNDQYNASSVVFDDTNTQLGAVNVQVAIEKTNDDINELNSNMNIIDEAISKLSEDIATKASAIKEKARGETIVVTDSAEAKPLGLAIDGKSEQNQYSGKNLYPYGDLSGNGGLLTEKPLVLPIGKYKFSMKTNVSSDIVTTIGFLDENKNNVTSIGMENSHWNTRNSITVNITSESKYISVYAREEITLSQIQIESGSEMTDYEPYCGGIPSPNPSYPQEIRNIGVYDEASGKYAVEVKLNTGQLFDYDLAYGKVDATDIIVNEDKVTFTTSNGYNQYALIFDDLPSGTYTFGYESQSNDGNNDVDLRAYYLANNVDDTLGNSIKETYTSKSLTFDYDNTKGRLIVWTRPRGACTITYNKLGLYSGNSLGVWTPYKETTATVLLPQPLRKGDKAYWNGGSKIRVDRYRDVEVFDGSDDEDLVAVSTYNSDKKRIRSGAIESKVKKYDINATADVYCNSHIATTAGNTFWNKSGISIDDNGWILIYDEKFDTSDISLFKSHLAENPMLVEYELATPITEEIDIDLGELSMFYPTTILSNDCNANMEVTYIADTKNYIDKLKAKHESDITALKTAIVALGGTV